MRHLLLRLLLTSAACLALAAPALAQDKPALTSRTAAIAKDKTAKRDALQASFAPKIATAFAGEEKLKAAMATDMAAIRAARTPQARKALAAAYQAKYKKDSQRILAKANISLQSVASQLRAIDPGMTYTVVGNTVVGQKTATSQSQSSQSQSGTSAPLAVDNVRTLAGNDFRVDIDTDCGPGWGETTQSGGYMKSQSEGCETSGVISHTLEVPAGKTVRVEMTASFAGEAHTINSYSTADSDIRIVDDRNDETIASEGFHIYAYALLVGDDATKEIRDARLVRDLGPGRYRIEGTTLSYGSGQIAGWAVAEAKLQAMRVKLTTFPRQ